MNELKEHLGLCIPIPSLNIISVNNIVNNIDYLVIMMTVLGCDVLGSKFTVSSVSQQPGHLLKAGKMSKHLCKRALQKGLSHFDQGRTWHGL